MIILIIINKYYIIIDANHAVLSIIGIHMNTMI